MKMTEENGFKTINVNKRRGFDVLGRKKRETDEECVLAHFDNYSDAWDFAHADGKNLTIRFYMTGYPKTVKNEEGNK